MIAVDDALARLFALVRPTGTETVQLLEADGRILARPVTATRDQPPFPASAMDGYALQGAAVVPGARFTVIGESAAGHGFDGTVGAGEAVRIFTGAPLPEGADRVVIQEDVTRDGETITLGDRLDTGDNIRPAANDFARGFTLDAPRRLTPNDIALLASMNRPEVTVARRPVVALISTGDELVMPGDDISRDQIIASNTFGLHALLRRLGAAPRLLPIARDTTGALSMAFDLARGADLVVTIGGASVGDHDLVARVAEARGMERSFYKVAMRPGKPLMAGRIDDAMMIGLPGNPVSAMVCGHVFLAPVVRAMLGQPAERAATTPRPLAAPIPANGPREHYMRAVREGDAVRVFDRQDSALLSVLARADTLVVRPPNDPARAEGETVETLALT